MGSTRIADGHTAPSIPEVDSLRGIAVLLVVIFHVDVLSGGQSLAGAGQTSLLGAFYHSGHTGVSLFFVLSGFLLAGPFLREGAGGPVVARRAFFARRVLRIMPLYLVAVGVASVRCAAQMSDLWRGLPYVFFLNAFPNVTTQLAPYSDPWWSLATEAQFYLLLPLVAWIGRRRWGWWVVAGGLLVWSFVYAGTVTDWLGTGTVVGRITLYASFFGRGPLFVFGAAVAVACPGVRRWAERRSPARGWAARAAPDVALAAVLGALGALLRAVYAQSYIGAELSWQWWHLGEGLLWAGVVLLVTAVPLRMRRLFSNPVLARIGVWSYSLYLLHFPLLWGMLHRRGTLAPWLAPLGMPMAVRATLAVGVCIACAAISYRLIEQPFLRWKAQWGTGVA